MSLQSQRPLSDSKAAIDLGTVTRQLRATAEGSRGSRGGGKMHGLAISGIGQFLPTLGIRHSAARH